VSAILSKNWIFRNEADHARKSSASIAGLGLLNVGFDSLGFMKEFALATFLAVSFLEMAARLRVPPVAVLIITKSFQIAKASWTISFA
jgi:hypothetical protein